jgi:hypothetical protein
MQARAIFEAAVLAGRDGDPVVPEVMIPLVSAKREVELVKARVDAVAAAVRAERGVAFAYRLGVMVETPRAALRAAEIAQHSAFLSFGTNDLTQMTYGLSRDDAGRFLGTYVGQGVFEEDPFHSLDLDGVGELLRIGASRGREGRPDVTLAYLRRTCRDAPRHRVLPGSRASTTCPAPRSESHCAAFRRSRCLESKLISSLNSIVELLQQLSENSPKFWQCVAHATVT